MSRTAATNRIAAVQRATLLLYSQLVLASTPVGYWKMGEASGDIADSSGNGLTGTKNGSPTYGKPSLIPADTATSINIPAATAFFSMGIQSLINAAGSWTYEVWLMPSNATGTSQIIMARGQETDNNFVGFNIRIDNQKFHFRVRTPTENVLDSTQLLKNGVVYHLVGVYNSSTNQMSIYINGQLEKSGSVTGSISAYSTTFRIASELGSTQDNNHNCLGTYGHGVIYNSALTGNVIAKHYAVGQSVIRSLLQGVQPTALSGLQLWLKADAITGLANGANVATWLDSSGNSRSATQSTSANQPTYQTNVINSLPVVRFNGSGNRALVSTLATVGYQIDITKPYTIFIIQSISALSDGSWISTAKGSDGTLGDLMRIKNTGAGSFRVFSGGAFYDSNYDSNNNQPQTGASIVTLINKSISGGGANDLQGFVNGMEQLTANVSRSTSINHDTVLGSAEVSPSGTGAGFAGDMAEIIIYNRALADTERVDIERYLGTKYNIGINIPVARSAVT